MRENGQYLTREEDRRILPKFATDCVRVLEIEVISPLVCGARNETDFGTRRCSTFLCFRNEKKKRECLMYSRIPGFIDRNVLHCFNETELLFTCLVT